MATSTMVGMVKCPICGNPDATVHEQQRGTKKGRLYYRCYTVAGGASMRCGTIQCIGQEGQQYLRANMRPVDGPKAEPAAEPEPAPPIGQPEPAPEPAAQPQPTRKRRGLLSAVAEAWGADDE